MRAHALRHDADDAARRLDALVARAAGARVVVVVAHPDDETLWCGATLSGRAADEVALVHLTDGAPADPWFARQAGCASADAYAALRARELEAALGALGLGGARRIALGARDQEAADALPRLTHALRDALDALEPDVVVAQAYEGGHPDHDAAAFVARAALALRRRDRRGAERPLLVECGGYHGAPGALATAAFLPRAGDARARARRPSPAERARKERALACFASQRAVVARLAPEEERFRPASTEDFGAPPHEGTLLYERHRWRADGAWFRARAREAARALGLPTVLG